MNSSEPNLYLWLIPLLPLIGAAINGIFGHRFSKSVVATVGLVFVAAAFAMSAWASLRLLQLPQGRIPYIEEHLPWITAGGFHVDFSFYLDQLSMVMILVVTFVGFLIHVYSVGYMAHEGGYYRFFAYLNLFMFSMLTLVLANNLLLLFVGWEGVGLCSYLLIGFYFLRDSAANAGKKAFIVNRIGDAGFLLGLLLVATTFGTVRFTSQGLADPAAFPGILQSLAALVGQPQFTYGAPVFTAIALLLFVGAAGKSAQIPLYVWLPDAMEGPTPVSALIHAATMVTAG